MRIAVCISGIVGALKGQGGRGKLLDPEFTFKFIKKNILDKNPAIDVFIHCWNVELEQQILDLYKPKLYIFESQKNFEEFNDMKNPIKNLKNLLSFLKLKLLEFLNNDFKKLKEREKQNACSRWYSNKRVIELKKKYEIKNNFTYDFVMITRFDVAFFKPLIFSKYCNSYFYASNWNDLPRPENNFKINFINNYEGKGFLDLWFFSNSKNMDLFSHLFDNIRAYSTSPHLSSREHLDTFLPQNKIKYIMYRWQDFEMVRAYFFKDLPPHGSSLTIIKAIKELFR